MCVICTSGVIAVTALSRDVTKSLTATKCRSYLERKSRRGVRPAWIELTPRRGRVWREAAATITIKRAPFDVAVRADGRVNTVTMTGGTVADALKGQRYPEGRGSSDSFRGNRFGAGYGNQRLPGALRYQWKPTGKPFL